MIRTNSEWFFRHIQHNIKRDKLSSWRWTCSQWTSHNMEKYWRHTEKMSSHGAYQCTTWLVSKQTCLKNVTVKTAKQYYCGCHGLLGIVVFRYNFRWVKCKLSIIFCVNYHIVIRAIVTFSLAPVFLKTM